MVDALDENRRLVDALARSLDEEDSPVEIMETHISWVLLSGDRALKFKKPVRFDFLDFTTLEDRHKFCEEEVRLNRRLAPELYLGVLPVTGTRDHPQLGGEGEVLEYAVEMVRFPQEALLERIAEKGKLSESMIEAMADELAKFHAGCDRAPAGSEFGRPKDIRFWVDDNFNELRTRVTEPGRKEQLAEFEDWCRATEERLDATLAARQAGGFVRECHGDLHLRNVAWLDGKPVFFDCLEFNPSLRWIDVMNEVAFVVMDLEDRGFPQLANLFLNRYLGESGDYEGVVLLDYYLVYRAMVRAKVVALRIEEGDLESGELGDLCSEFDTYVRLVRSYLHRPAPLLVLMHGLSGSGKSTVAMKLAEETGAIRIRSDVERKRLFHLEALARTESPVGEGIYDAAASENTYARLAACAAGVLRAGRTAIVDAAFLKRQDRERLMQAGIEAGADVALVCAEAPVPTLEERVMQRQAEGSDPSEAGMEVLAAQIAGQEPLDEGEKSRAFIVDTTKPVDLDELLGALSALRACRN